MIIPSIDIMDGKAVQLEQGTRKKLERDNVFELAREFRKYGEIAVIDLDAALGIGNNINLIKDLCKIADCRVGGGIRSLHKARTYLKAGASKIIIGTCATPEFLQQLPKQRLIVAVDTKDGKVVTEGWQRKTSQTALTQMQELSPYCSEFLFTDVNVEGMLQGIRKSLIQEIMAASPLPITIAGGISTISDIQYLEKLNANAQIGMAIYTNQINLPEAFTSIIDFDKQNGLIPTIVQDRTKQVVMLAYSSKSSLLKSFATNLGWYFSRSRQQLWQKGETSGNTQRLLKVRYDCDKDTLLFTVDQQGNACHLNRYSCFGNKEFSLDDLYSVILDRVENPHPNSYTSKIARNEADILAKVKEEAMEVCEYTDRKNLIWEVADLTYFLIVLLAKHNIRLEEIKFELQGRRS